MTNSIKKNDFVTAYVCMYGSTKKKALEVFKEKEADDSYINDVIDWFKQTAKFSFYND